VTIPASTGEPYSMSVKRTSAIATIDWAIRASCIASRIRGSHGTARSAR
jgi:hypothetical protein